MFLHELDDKQKEAFICLAHDVVVSDGELSAGERWMMDDLKREIASLPSLNLTTCRSMVSGKFSIQKEPGLQQLLP